MRPPRDRLQPSSGKIRALQAASSDNICFMPHQENAARGEEWRSCYEIARAQIFSCKGNPCCQIGSRAHSAVYARVRNLGNWRIGPVSGICHSRDFALTCGSGTGLSAPETNCMESFRDFRGSCAWEIERFMRLVFGSRKMIAVMGRDSFLRICPLPRGKADFWPPL